LKKKKIGVFVCHCGLNIAGSVDVERVVEQIKDYPGSQWHFNEQLLPFLT
jgi:heterodisulfide reductase subunit A-like polyferredoxin